MEDRLITTKEVGNYRIKIYYDTDSVCPCESWDMAACFLWEYSDSSRLQYVCDWREVFGKYGDSRHSLIDALHKLISEYVEWEEVDSCWGYYMETDELIEEIMKEHNLKE